jgi:arylsulfatase A-like enzyme
VPSGIDGTSVLKTWRGGEQPELQERFLYWEFHEGGFKQAGRWKNWKILRNRREGASELYDLSKDVGELNNVAEANAELVRELEGRLRSAREESVDWPVVQAKGPGK